MPDEQIPASGLTPRRRGRPPLTPEQREARRAARLAELRSGEAELSETVNVGSASSPEEAAEADFLQDIFEGVRYDEDLLEMEHSSEVVVQNRTLKVHIYPFFSGEDQGDGGIRRVVEAQTRYLSAHGVSITDSPEEADVIAYHATVPPPYIRNFPRKAFVAMCHGMYWEEYDWSGAWHTAANREVMEGLRVADHIIACSEWVANAIRRHLSRPVTVLYHGVDMEEWANLEGLTNRGYVLWNKTRPDPVCDPEPMNAVASMLPDVMFVSTFGQEAPNVALSGKLPFEDAKRLVLQAGAYLCTSRETFGIGTLEAMASGVPVVGFNFGGQAEFIEHGVDGWLATPGDFHGLAEGIRWALGSNRDNIGTAARRKASAFNWNRIADQYAEIFNSVAAGKALDRLTPRVSIIVTHHNLSQYLADCLASVLNQTDSDWECIVVDDASSPEDRTEAVTITANAAGMGANEDQFKFEVLTENVYLAEARNHGIRMARGRYILPLDADDMLAPNAVALLADALDSDRTISVAYGNVEFREEDGVTLTNYGQQFLLGHSSWPYPFSHEYQIMQRNLLPYCSMFRQEAWLNTGGYRRRCRTAEDADFWTRLSSYGYRPKMVTEADTLIYRNRVDSMSRIQGEVDWVRWFPWSKNVEITPAGAGTKEQLPIPSLDPIVVSVIIPVGPGHGKIVTDAIDSVDAQFFREWEVIVVNDTGAPLETELPAWVKVLQTTGHKGVAFARNMGIRASKGRYFLPLDADDYLEPDALSFMVEAMRQAGGNEIIYTDFWQENAEGQISIHQTDDYDPQLITGRRRQINNEWREGMMHSATVLTPKKVWEQIGGYDETLSAWEDWDFQIAAGNIGICSRRVAIPLFFYRKGTGYRREENFAFFERSREGIMAKWGNLWEGGRELMVCGSCSRGNTVNAAPTWNKAAAIQHPQNADAVLLKYTGTKAGSIGYRGQSRTLYYFGAGDERYVLSEDVQHFLDMGDFEIVQARVIEAAVSNDEPILLAPGQV